MTPSRFRTPRRLATATLLVLATALLTTAPSALAAAPATPTVTVETLLPGGPTPAGDANLHGTLSPGTPGEAGSLYQFHYKEFKEGETPVCTGGASAPGSPGIALGEENEPVNETIYLSPATKYAVCLSVENLSAESATSATVTFTTAFYPEQPYPREPHAVTATSAELRGELNPLTANEAGTYQFAYGQNGECSTATAIGEDLGAKGEIVSTKIEGLEPNRQYTFCVTEYNDAGEPGGSNPLNFRTAAPAPTVTAETATPVGPFEEHLGATVDPENQTATCVVEYGPTTSYGTSRPCEQATIEGGEQPVSVTVKGLAAETEYDYRFALENAAHETTYGTGSFTTATKAPPVIESDEVTGVSATGVTFQAQIDPEYQPTSFAFEYSTSEASGALTGTVETVEGSSELAGSEAQTASAQTGAVLQPGTTYFYRATAENGTTPNAATAVKSFTTPPAAMTEPATGVTATAATFHGTLGPLNPTATSYHFSYQQGGGCTGESALQSKLEEPGTGTGETIPATATVEGLQPGAAYSVCLVASNEYGQDVGPAVHFSTPAAAPKVDSEYLHPPEGSEPRYEALLEAQINPDGQETHYAFEYSTTESGGVLTGSIVTVHGTAALPAGTTDQTAAVETGHALEAGTTYYFRAVAENASGQGAGAVTSFKTPAATPPEIYGETASELGPTSAVLEVQVFPSYQPTTVTFDFAPTEDEVRAGEGQTVTAPVVEPGSIPTGFGAREAAATATGLLPNHTYYYRAAAVNGAGAAKQNLTIQSFTTTTTPLVTTGEASTPTANATTISGTVNPQSSPTTYFVQYGGTSSYGSSSPHHSAVTGTAPVNVEVPLEGLQPGRTYHYRLVAENTTGGVTYTGYGEDRTFTTPSTPPLITGLTATSVTQTTALITASLDPQGLPTRYELQLGAVQGQLQPITSATTGSATAVSLAVGDLTPGTTYFYRLIATSSDGTIEPESVFTTLPGPASAAAGSLPALIPYTPISTITAKQETENKQNSKPTSLTNKQKLAKALKQCRKDKKKHKRAECEREARKRYPVEKKK